MRCYGNNFESSEEEDMKTTNGSWKNYAMKQTMAEKMRSQLNHYCKNEEKKEQAEKVVHKDYIPKNTLSKRIETKDAKSKAQFTLTFKSLGEKDVVSCTTVIDIFRDFV